MKFINEKILKSIQEDYNKGLNDKYRSLFYRKEKGIRAPYIKYAHTSEELYQYALCVNEIFYFIETYCKVRDVVDGEIKTINLYGYQTKTLDDLIENRFFILLWSRQTGKTLIMSLFILYNILFTKKNVVIIANKSHSGIELLEKIRELYRRLPFFLKPGVVTNTQRRIDFDNGSKIIITCSPEACLSFNVDILFLDEFAYLAPKFKTSVLNSYIPSVSSIKDSHIVVASTPNGFDKFYDMVQGAYEKTNNFKVSKAYWYDVPGKDKEWKDNMISNFGEESFNNEYELKFKGKQLPGKYYMDF